MLKFLPLFRDFFTRHHNNSRTKRHIDKLKCLCQSTMCPLKADLLSVAFDQETAEMRWRIVTHLIKIQHFPSLLGFPHKRHWTQILPHVRRFKGLTIDRKNVGKIRPKKFRTQPKLKFLANTFFATSSFDTAYIRKKTSHRQIKMLASVYDVSSTRRHTFRDLWTRNG